MECFPIGKNTALVHCAASAASTAGVFRGQGPSSKVSTTSPSRRKSWLLKCSNPKPGPPVVSISTTRATPKAFGFEHEGADQGGARGRGEACAVTVGTPVTARPSAGASTSDRLEIELFCNKMAPNTATHSTIASA